MMLFKHMILSMSINVYQCLSMSIHEHAKTRELFFCFGIVLSYTIPAHMSVSFWSSEKYTCSTKQTCPKSFLNSSKDFHDSSPRRLKCLGVSLVLNVKRHSSRVPHKPPVDTIVRLDEGPVIGLLVSRSPSWSLLPPELLWWLQNSQIIGRAVEWEIQFHRSYFWCENDT